MRSENLLTFRLNASVVIRVRLKDKDFHLQSYTNAQFLPSQCQRVKWIQPKSSGKIVFAQMDSQRSMSLFPFLRAQRVFLARTRQVVISRHRKSRSFKSCWINWSQRSASTLTQSLNSTQLALRYVQSTKHKKRKILTNLFFIFYFYL